MVKNNEYLIWGKDVIQHKDATFRYMMLDRLRVDCEYFLGNGNRNEKHLWAGDVERHIKLMKDLYNSFEEKPEWISMKDIENYEKRMGDKSYFVSLNGERISDYFSDKTEAVAWAVQNYSIDDDRIAIEEE